MAEVLMGWCDGVTLRITDAEQYDVILSNRHVGTMMDNGVADANDRTYTAHAFCFAGTKVGTKQTFDDPNDAIGWIAEVGR